MSQLETEEDADMVLRAFIPANGAFSIVDSSNKALINVESLVGLGQVEGHVNPSDSYTIDRFEGIEALSISMPIIGRQGKSLQLE